MGSQREALIHKTAEIEDRAEIDLGTNVWGYAHIREYASVGQECNIGRGVFIDVGVSVGNKCKIQNYACLYRGAHIEDEVFIGPHAILTNDSHPRAVSSWKPPNNVCIWVGKGASIGAGAIILPEVIIGRGAMVGAGAVVTEDVPDGATVVGVPAQ